MAEHILYTLEHPELQEQLRTASKQELAGLSWQHSAKKMQSLYQQLTQATAGNQLRYA